jgi:hypothetical protein
VPAPDTIPGMLACAALMNALTLGSEFAIACSCGLTVTERGSH